MSHLCCLCMFLVSLPVTTQSQQATGELILNDHLPKTVFPPGTALTKTAGVCSSVWSNASIPANRQLSEETILILTFPERKPGKINFNGKVGKFRRVRRSIINIKRIRNKRIGISRTKRSNMRLLLPKTPSFSEKKLASRKTHRSNVIESHRARRLNRRLHRMNRFEVKQIKFAGFKRDLPKNVRNRVLYSARISAGKQMGRMRRQAKNRRMGRIVRYSRNNKRRILNRMEFRHFTRRTRNRIGRFLNRARNTVKRTLRRKRINMECNSRRGRHYIKRVTRHTRNYMGRIVHLEKYNLRRTLHRTRNTIRRMWRSTRRNMGRIDHLKKHNIRRNMHGNRSIRRKSRRVRNGIDRIQIHFNDLGWNGEKENVLSILGPENRSRGLQMERRACQDRHNPRNEFNDYNAKKASTMRRSRLVTKLRSRSRCSRFRRIIDTPRQGSLGDIVSLASDHDNRVNFKNGNQKSFEIKRLELRLRTTYNVDNVTTTLETPPNDKEIYNNCVPTPTYALGDMEVLPRDSTGKTHSGEKLEMFEDSLPLRYSFYKHDSFAESNRHILGILGLTLWMTSRQNSASV